MTNNSKIYYIDSYSQNSNHEMFNTSLILMCSIIFDKLECKLIKTNYIAITKLLDNKLPVNAKFSFVKVLKGDTKFIILFRYIYGTFINLYYLLIIKKNATIIFPFNNIFSLRLINLISKFSNKKIIVFCHSEMEAIASDANKEGLLSVVLDFLAKNFFKNKNIKISENIFFGVIGDLSKKNLLQILPEKFKGRIISIDHPYLFGNFDSNKKTDIDSKFNIGTIGSIHSKKKLYKIINFINKIDLEIRDKLSISINGSFRGDLETVFKNNILLPLNNVKEINRKVFNDAINELDLILFFYSKENYKITASGAIMDSLNLEVPILAIKNEYFNYLFEKYGHFGFLCDDENQMVEKLREIVSENIKIDFDFKNIKRNFSIEMVAKQLKNEFLTIGILK